MIRAALVAHTLLWSADPGLACSVIRRPSAGQLVERASLIVRARAVGVSAWPGDDGGWLHTRRQITFEPLEVIRGSLHTVRLLIAGRLSDADDFNDRPVPYGLVRPGGRRGNCVALDYRAGDEYLLMLRPRSGRRGPAAGTHTPYWASLQPTNEQLSGGADDPWVVWVRAQVQRKSMSETGRINLPPTSPSTP